METPWTSSACPPSVVLGGPARLSERWPQGAWAGAHALCRGLWPRERPEAGGGGQDRRVAAGALVPRILSLQIGRTGTRALGSEFRVSRSPLSPEFPANPGRVTFHALHTTASRARPLCLVRVGARTSEPRSGARQSRLL